MFQMFKLTFRLNVNRSLISQRFISLRSRSTSRRPRTLDTACSTSRTTTCLWSSVVGRLCLAGPGLVIPAVKSQSVSLEKTRLVRRKDELYVEPKFDWEEFFKLIWPEIWYLLAAIVSALAVAVVNIQIPVYLGTLVNVVSQFATNRQTDMPYMDELREPVLKLISIYGLQSILTFVYISLLQSMGERMTLNLKTKLFESIIIQDIEFFDRTKTGEIMNRLTTDVHDFKSAFKMCISQGLRSFAQVIGSTISLFMISPKLTGVMVAVVPGIVAVGTLFGATLRRLSKAAQAQVAHAAAVADEAISNIRTVRAFAMETKEQSLYVNEVSEACVQNQKLGVGIAVFQSLTNFALNGIVLGVIYVGGSLMSQSELTPGDLMSFLVATQTIQKSLAQMSMLFGHAVRGVSAGARIIQYIKMRPLIPISGMVGSESIDWVQVRDHACIQFKDVEFSYPARKGQTVLNGFNLDIASGQIVALCGLSGAGKSTVATLLERFYDVDAGTILVCDKPLTTLNPHWLRGELIGFINQEPKLFATSIRENIRYGKPDASDKEVETAARLANAHSFIVNFPDKYDTTVGEHGVTVSGGQKQRIAIARALLKNPAILILDEATSALDAESERLVQEALDRVMKGRTVIVIAHRLSTIKNADVIAVMKNGTVAEIGKHDELLKKKGIYWNLIRQQQFTDDVTT